MLLMCKNNWLDTALAINHFRCNFIFTVHNGGIYYYIVIIIISFLSVLSILSLQIETGEGRQREKDSTNKEKLITNIFDLSIQFKC